MNPTMLPRLWRWSLRLFVAAVLGGALFVATGYHLGAERWWLLAFIQYLPYPLHLAPAIAAVAASWRLAWPARLAAATALLLAVVPIMGLELSGLVAGGHAFAPAGARLEVASATVGGAVVARATVTSTAPASAAAVSTAPSSAAAVSAAAANAAAVSAAPSSGAAVSAAAPNPASGAGAVGLAPVAEASPARAADPSTPASAAMAATPVRAGATAAAADPRELEATRPVRVMTYNVKGHLAMLRPGGLQALGREIDAHDPDILLLQDQGSATQTLRGAGVAPLLGTRHRYVRGQFVIASREPLRDCAPSASLPGNDETFAVHCTVRLGGREVSVYSVHLRTPRNGLNAARREALAGIDDWLDNVADRMAQSEALAREIRASPRPVILGGDLNAPEVSLVVRQLLGAGLRDAFSAAGIGYGYTYGHALRFHFTFLRLDHVLVSPAFEVIACRAGGSEASEHRPVIADLFLARGTAAP